MSRGKSHRHSKGNRRCLITGPSDDRARLIRFVLDDQAQVTPDILEKLDGRGVWLRADRDILSEAIKKNAFSRGFKCEAKIPPNLIETIEANLTKHLIGLISLARKTGQAVCGATKVADMLNGERATLLLQASDGSAREKRNLSGRRHASVHFECLSGHELGMAFGRECVIHAALAGAGLAIRVKDEAQRLSLSRGLVVDTDIGAHAGANDEKILTRRTQGGALGKPAGKTTATHARVSHKI